MNKELGTYQEIGAGGPLFYRLTRPFYDWRTIWSARLQRWVLEVLVNNLCGPVWVPVDIEDLNG